MNTKNTRFVVISALGAALYFVLSLTLKIPLVGNITIDAGYITLMIYCYIYGTIPALVCGAIGCALESILLSAYGFSIGWFVMNVIIALIVSEICNRTDKPGVIVITIFFAVLLGVISKTAIECQLYSIPVAVKAPKSIAAFLSDSVVMVLSLPIARKIKDRLVTVK